MGNEGIVISILINDFAQKKKKLNFKEKKQMQFRVLSIVFVVSMMWACTSSKKENKATPQPIGIVIHGGAGTILRKNMTPEKEAAYRKILVIAEDDNTIRPKSIDELFLDVRSIHFKSYIRYLYFNIGRIAYLQANVLSAYVFLAPAIVTGAITLGVMQQIIRAFGRVEGSMQYILKAWPTIIELASVYKRLREFERQIEK